VRAALARSTAPAAGRAADVWHMVQWARNAGIRLVNVHEVFNADAPIGLQSEFLAELSKGAGPGYAAASDILRLYVAEFGPYCDIDNEVRSIDLIGPVLRSRQGIGLHHGRRPLGLTDRMSNDLYIASRGHPMLAHLRSAVQANYQ